MGLEVHYMDVETPTGARERLDGLHQRGGRRSTRGKLIEPYPRGFFPLHWDVVLGSPMMSPMTYYDFIQ